MNSENSLQTSETNERPTSEQDEGIPIATMSEDLGTVGGEKENSRNPRKR
jgi:hypothetical protein